MKNKSVKHKISSKKLSSAQQWGKAFFVILIIAIFSSCKDENDLGLNILPPDDQIGTEYSDTATVLTNTVREDSLRGDELSFQLLGSDNDPTFGRTSTSIFAQVTLAGTPAFPDSVVADSLILSLHYAGYYGDTNQTQNFSIFQMKEQMYIDSDYYTSRRLLYDESNPLATVTGFQPKPKTNAIVDSEEVAPQIRVKLATWLADTLVKLSGELPFSSNDEWLAWFNGIYIKSDSSISGPGAISYLNFFNSAMTLYFHDTTDSTPYTYNFSLKDGKLNAFYHDYTGSTAGNSIGVTTDTLNYLQSMSGLKTKISFPYLKHFTDSGSILINRAELQISSRVGTTDQPLPGRLLLVTKDGSGNTVFPIDYFETSGYYGGGLNATQDGYRFIITRHLQAFLDGSVPNADFFLIVAGSGVEATRNVIRSGSSGGDLQMKLILSYTKTN